MERNEWPRAAWKVMLAKQIDPKQLVFVDEMATNTSLAPLFGPARLKGEERTARCLVTGVRTRACFRA